MKTPTTDSKNPRRTPEVPVVVDRRTNPFNPQDAAYSEVLFNAYTVMASAVKDERDELQASIVDDDVYQGTDVQKLVDQAIDGVLGVIEVNMVRPRAHKGLSDIYFDMINT